MGILDNWKFSNRNQGAARAFIDGGSARIVKDKIRQRRDTDARRLETLLANGEPFWVVDPDNPELDKRFYIGDGVTLGGIEIGGSEGGDTYKVKVSSTDTTPNYLSLKVEAGTGISFEVSNEGGDEKLTISADGIPDVGDFVKGPGDGVDDATDNALVRWDTTTGRLVQNSNAILNDGGDLALYGRMGVNNAGVASTTTVNVADAFEHTADTRWGVDVLVNLQTQSSGTGSLTAIRGQAIALGCQGPQSGVLTGVEGYALLADSDDIGIAKGLYGNAVVAVGSPIAAAFGVHGITNYQSASDTPLIAGGAFFASHEGASNIPEIYGVIGNATMTNAAASTDVAAGGLFYVTKDAGSIGTAIGAVIYTPTVGAANRSWRVTEAGGGLNYIDFLVPALAANYTWTFPNTDGSALQVLQTDGSGVLSWVDRPYDFRGFYPTVTDAGICDVWRTVRAYTIADDFAGSYATAETGATADAVFTVYKATGTGAFSSIGTITFANGGSGGRQAGTFATSGGSVSMSAGDCLKIVAPGTADATLANVSVVIKGTLAE